MTVAIEQTLARLNELTEEEAAGFYRQLHDHINWMIENRFEQLVQLLYRLDVDEQKLKTLLTKDNDKNSAEIISFLIIERQLQKLNARKQKNSDPNILEDERW